MKKLFIVLLLFSITFIYANELTITEKIEKYSGENADELTQLLETQEGDTLRYLNFLLENCSNNDLSVLTEDYLMTNIEFAIKAKKFKYANYSEDIFRHFVLPHRVSQEPLEDWREKFYTELKPLVENVEDIKEAAILVNLWALEQITFKQTSGRDQAPLTTIKRGIGRCEEMMILYIAAARSVGIPTRTASVPFWNFTNNNHAWVEIWTPDGWKYTGGAEPANSLNKAWFTKTSQRATLITSRAFGNYESKNTIKRKDNVTTISSIEYYTDFEYVQIKVKDEENKLVTDANVVLYAASYGGLFPITELKSDENGLVKIPLGKGTVFVTAFKDDKLGYSILNTMENNSLEITLSENNGLNEHFNFLFPIPFENSDKAEQKEVLGDKYKLMRENADLKRKDRLNSQKKNIELVKYYDLSEKAEKQDSTFLKNREEFLKKCDDIAGNIQQFLYLLDKTNNPQEIEIIVNMIEKWNIKELCEIPDSTAIQTVVDIFIQAKNNFPSIPDSVFVDNVIGFTWRSATPPQNGWQKDFYPKIEKLIAKNPAKTVKKVIKWVDKNIVVDEDFVWTYFSGSLNPNDILNMKTVPEFYRTKLINSTLKLLGVPIQWKGRLEFFDGKDFVAVEEKDKKEEQDHKKFITVSIFVDGEKVKADSYENFLIAKLSEEGAISNTYFDGENDSLDYKANYRYKDDDNVYIESFVRNRNGDANIIVKSIEVLDSVKIELITPKEYLDNSDKWCDETKQNIINVVEKGDSISFKLLFVRGEIPTEPEERMLEQLSAKTENFQKNNIELILYSEMRAIADLDDLKGKFKIITGNKIISENIENYPILFLLDKENEIVFSSIGYNMGISDLLLKKVK
ncbi:MAG: transglutaminase-like domain-containing protein [Candidatus Celaenobacter antarcticus]|nr:transglutaminase-like domain-containing protein [Candidatus Celaenobacter antarcticus]